MSWPPEAKISEVVGGDWPVSLRSFAQWAVADAPSIYLLHCAQEIVESLIRADALDVTALKNVCQLSGVAAAYSTESIHQKMDALRIINVRIAAMGLDQPLNMGWEI
ncbi:hypothetical protein GCM10023175_00490 [Pseudonocardia xishanensis]|uniref:Uncharacterized protein n=1 Tax=Pseudonocardia xishanensis TaxID=630995 RepID=A0ABP8RCC7_9PSEU